MKTKQEMQVHIGNAMGHLALGRNAMMQRIADHNNVSIETVYRWLNSVDPINYGRIEGSIEAILNEKKGAKA